MRGYRTLLLEQHDFAKATSSRSTKLVHGGVRYLQQGNVSLVMEALRERGRLLANAPHVAHNLPFVVPIYDWWDGPFYGVGMKLYDMLAGKLGLGPSKVLSRERTIELLPNVETRGLRSGVIYHDGQFDDARLAISLAATIVDKGGTVLNYVRVTAFKKRGNLIAGVRAKDLESGEEFEFDGRVVVNAANLLRPDTSDGRSPRGGVDSSEPGRTSGAKPLVPPGEQRHNGAQDSGWSGVVCRAVARPCHRRYDRHGYRRVRFGTYGAGGGDWVPARSCRALP